MNVKADQHEFLTSIEYPCEVTPFKLFASGQVEEKQINRLKDISSLMIDIQVNLEANYKDLLNEYIYLLHFHHSGDILRTIRHLC